MKPKKVLLAEDDADDRAFFREFIGERDDVVLLPMAGDGMEVFEYLDAADAESALPDAIILDQNMPKRNGLQTLQLLKSSSRYSRIPVMVYSTYADDNLVAASTTSGAVAVLPKPFTSDGYNKMMDTFFGLLG